MKNMKKTLACALVLFTVVKIQAAEISAFAAASLTDSLKEIAAAYENQSGDKIIFNSGASSTLAALAVSLSLTGYNDCGGLPSWRIDPLH
jgi:molybdate transport system substrate-binding protein